MKFLESHFDEYVQAVDGVNLHPELAGLLPTELGHVCFYGPAGAGKYSQALQFVRQFSPSQLKYEKKLQVCHDKRTYQLRLSDVHVEIDMALLGCNAKLLWHEMIQQIEDMVRAKPEKRGLVVCKHFHETHLELLDVFYSYLQSSCIPGSTTHHGPQLFFVLLTNHLSFLPDPLRQSCRLIRVARPARPLYNQCLHHQKGLPRLPRDLPLASLRNIKLLALDTADEVAMLHQPHEPLCQRIWQQMVAHDALAMDLLRFREWVHDVFICQLSVPDCVWFWVRQAMPRVSNPTELVLATLTFFRMLNANFRPVFHLEHWLLQVTVMLHPSASTFNT